MAVTNCVRDMTNAPVSLGIAIPSYSARGNGIALLRRALESIESQVTQPAEVVVSAELDFFVKAEKLVNSFANIPNIQTTPNMFPRGIGGNSNSALRILSSTHAIVLHQDDAMLSPTILSAIHDHLRMFDDPWLVLGSAHGDPLAVDSAPGECIPPTWRGAMYLLSGRNPLGGPSTCVWRRASGLRFAESLELMVDIDFYLQALHLWKRPPSFLDQCMSIGSWDGQAQNHVKRSRVLREMTVLWGRYVRRSLGHITQERT